MCVFHSSELDADISAGLRIAKGSPGNIVSFPWQVSLLHNGVHHCGGSIISSQWILSAAHCTVGRDLNDFTIRVGSSWRGTFGEIINISRIIDHPNYSMPPVKYDFTLIQLSQPLIFDERIQPIELPDVDTTIADGTLCITTGWGNHFICIPYIANDSYHLNSLFPLRRYRNFK